MITNDPYRAPEVPRDPTRDPNRFDEERQATIWLPVAIAVTVFLGIAYYFYGQIGPSPAMRADSGGITKSEPSPN